MRSVLSVFLVLPVLLFGAATAGAPASCRDSALALRVLAAAAELRHLPGFLAVLAAEFSEASALFDRALARRMRALLRRTHGDLLRGLATFGGREWSSARPD